MGVTWAPSIWTSYSDVQPDGLRRILVRDDDDHRRGYNMNMLSNLINACRETSAEDAPTLTANATLFDLGLKTEAALREFATKVSAHFSLSADVLGMDVLAMVPTLSEIEAIVKEALPRRLSPPLLPLPPSPPPPSPRAASSRSTRCARPSASSSWRRRRRLARA